MDNLAYGLIVLAEALPGIDNSPIIEGPVPLNAGVKGAPAPLNACEAKELGSLVGVRLKADAEFGPLFEDLIVVGGAASFGYWNGSSSSETIGTVTAVGRAARRVLDPSSAVLACPEPEG